MAAIEANESACGLVQVGTLTLERRDYRRDLDYISILVLSPEMVFMVDYEAAALRLHSLQDGHILAVYDRLNSIPQDTCICSIDDNEITIALCLLGGQIDILSIKTKGQTLTITAVRTLDVRTQFDYCYGMKYRNENLLIIGKKLDNMFHYNLCWGIVPITDSNPGQVHNICKCEKVNWSYLSTNPRYDNMVYISYWADADITGVYGYRNDTLEFVYRQKDLVHPTGMTVDRRGFIFICNMDPDCIFQLTEKGQLVKVFKEGMPSSLQAIVWEEQQGLLYLASWNSNIIPIYKPVYSNQLDTAAIPAEILKMNDHSIQLFKEALKHGEVRVYNIRVMVVGHFGVGKTTTIKRLLGKEVNIRDKQHTEGIIVHVHCCRVSRDTLKWTSNEGDSELDSLLQRLAEVLKKKQSTHEKFDKESIMTPPQKKSILDNDDDDSKDTQPLDSQSHQQNFGQDLSTTSELDRSLSNVDRRKFTNCDTNSVARTKFERESSAKDPIRETLHLLRKNADKLKTYVDKFAYLTILDFAGQTAFYTTHQIFLTRRAIYLLVSDASAHVNDLVDDECYFNSDGVRECRVHELVEVWLNAIHSCAPYEMEYTNSTSTYKALPPPVILVGTHVDQIPQDDRHMISERYFGEIRSHLSDKPSKFHLVDEDFAIDNTTVDSKLEDLKRKIVEVASQQIYWGEKRPAHWLPLEQAFMKLKAEGVKVIAFSLVEELNQAGSVHMSANEIDLFLRFQHDIGTIMYFSMEGLKDMILLDPQWIIDALKSLITAEMFILRKSPAISDKWLEFKNSGKLSQELIDAVWSKENGSEFCDHKAYLLLLMEKLNIIARPRSYSQDGKEIKVENYFLAPCMLREKVPLDVISPKTKPNTETSSILCYVFVENFLPSPIFHRLLAACLAHWPIAKKNSENLIFCGCCVFDLDLHHSLTVFFREHVIFVRVTRIGTTENTLFSKWCINVREFITMTLSKVIGSLGHNLRFELSIQCPEFDGYAVNGLIAVAVFERNVDVPCHLHHDSHVIISRDMLKFWFPEEETGKLSKPEGVTSTEQVSSTCSQKAKLHQRVLNRRLPDLVKGLDFKTVSIYIQQKELFDDVTIRDILDQRTSTEQIRELITRIYLRDEETYDKFKECLVQAKQAFLKALLEEEEAILTQGRVTE